MSSCGRVKGRRPSLADWSDSMKRYQSMDLEQKNDNGNTSVINALMIVICEEESSTPNPVDYLQVTNGISLKEALSPYLRTLGITIDMVDCMLENSRTPIPDNSEAIYLVGRKIFVKGKKGTRITLKRKTSFTGETDTFCDSIPMVKTSLGHNTGAKTLYQLQQSNSKGILSGRKGLSLSSNDKNNTKSPSSNVSPPSAIYAAAAIISAVPETIAMKKCTQKNVTISPLSVVIGKQVTEDLNNSPHRHSLPMALLTPDMIPKRIPSLRKTSSALQFQLSKTRNLSTCTTPPPLCPIPAATTSAPNQQNHPNTQFFHNSIDSNSSLTGSFSANSTPGNNSLDSGNTTVTNTSRKISIGISGVTSHSNFPYNIPPNNFEDPMSVTPAFQHAYLFANQNGGTSLNGHPLTIQGPSSFGVTSFQICGCPFINGMPGIHDSTICHYANMVMPTEENTGKRARSSTSTRMSLFFGKDKQDMISRLNALKDECLSRNDLSELELEKHWSCFVKNSKEMSKQEMEQQEIIWEVISTEQRYIFLLKQMDELCYYFNEMQKLGFLRDVNGRRVFLNFAELFQCNKVFWSKSVLPILKESRDKGTPLSFKPLLEGFDEINEWFKCYIFFNCHAKDAHSYIQKRESEHEFFHEFILWAESQDTMKRQKLLDIFTAPMQRMTRYALLTKAYLKTIEDRKDFEYIKSVYDKIDEANSIMDTEMAQNMIRNQLAEIMSFIEGYDVVDNDEFERLYNRSTKHILNLIQPMPYLMGPPRFRRVFYKGEMRLRENRNGPKTDVLCYVMTDMFLICKMVNKNRERLRVMRPPMHITNVIIYPFQDYTGFYLVYTNEFDALSALYMMYTGSVDETRRWVEFLNIAQEEFRTLRRINEPCYEMANLEELPLHHGVHIHQLSGEPGTYPCVAHNRRVSYGMGNPYQEGLIIPDQGYVHRKSNSMDSQVLALNNQQSVISAATTRHHHVRSSTTLLNPDNNEFPVINGIIRGPRNTTVGVHYNTSERSRKKINNNDTTITSHQPVSMAHSKSSIDMNNSNKNINIKQNSELKVSKVRSRSNSSGNISTKQDHTSRSVSPNEDSKKIKSTTDTSSECNKDLSEECNIDECNDKEKKKSADNSIKAHNTTLDEENVVLEINATTINETINEEEHAVVGDEFPLNPTNGNGIFGRRFERRYHTADQIDIMKPKNTLQTSILKRFSLNLSNAVSGSSRKISNRIYDQNLKKNNQNSTVVSSDSFGSSTSGISSASSHDTNGIIIDNIDSSDNYRGYKKGNVCNVSVSDHPYEKGKIFRGRNDSKTLHIHLEEETISNEEVVIPKDKSACSTPPPVPQVSPPAISEGEGENDVFEQEQDILQYILDNKLETSDV
uniref:DH domain-containing protein n=1 Tax=Parastrongyloides trichosuri TaxID=131310 RepID=A0A0N4ZC12_PARTI